MRSFTFLLPASVELIFTIDRFELSIVYMLKGDYSDDLKESFPGFWR